MSSASRWAAGGLAVGVSLLTLCAAPELRAQAQGEPPAQVPVDPLSLAVFGPDAASQQASAPPAGAQAAPPATRAAPPRPPRTPTAPTPPKAPKAPPRQAPPTQASAAAPEATPPEAAPPKVPSDALPQPESGAGGKPAKAPPEPQAAAAAAPGRSWLREGQPANPSPATQPAPQATGLSWGYAASGLLLLALVGGAVLQRRHKRRLVKDAKLSSINVVSSARLGTKAQVVIAKVGDRLLLLGVTEHEVTKIDWLDAPSDPSVPEPVSTAALHLAAANDSTTAPSHPGQRPKFRQLLFDAMGIGDAGANEASSDAALQVAEETRDVVTRSPQRPQSPATSNAGATVSVEGQAAGLIARLAERGR